MSNIKSGLMFLDPYDRPARLYPSLLVFMPLAVMLVCLYGEKNLVASTTLSILGFCGVAYAISRFARDAGKRLQEKLFIKWGGAPTTQLLRHTDSRIDTHTKERYHQLLSMGIGKKMPSIAEEHENPKAADELYRAASSWLIGQTRDKEKFSLLFKENVAFGFQRNALGLRWLGLCVSFICMLWVLFHENALAFTAPYVSYEYLLSLSPASIVTLSVSIFMFVSWLVFITESALKRTGFTYAERLLESSTNIQNED